MSEIAEESVEQLRAALNEKDRVIMQMQYSLSEREEQIIHTQSKFELADKMGRKAEADFYEDRQRL